MENNCVLYFYTIIVAHYKQKLGIQMKIIYRFDGDVRQFYSFQIRMIDSCFMFFLRFLLISTHNVYLL